MRGGWEWKWEDHQVAVEGIQRKMMEENGSSDRGEKQQWRELDLRCETVRGAKSGSFQVI